MYIYIDKIYIYVDIEKIFLITGIIFDKELHNNITYK